MVLRLSRITVCEVFAALVAGQPPEPVLVDHPQVVKARLERESVRISFGWGLITWPDVTFSCGASVGSRSR